MKVLVPYGNDVVETIRNILGDEATVVQSGRDLESMLEKGRDVEVIASGRVSGDFIRNAHNLRMVQHFGAGIDKIDREAVLAREGLIVCNSHLNSSEVAEYAISLLLALAKRIVLSDRDLRRGEWTYGWGGPRPNIEMKGKTCLIIGLGNIGAEVAKRLRAFDMRLTSATRSGISNNELLVDTVVKIENVEPLVREVDVVILTLPLTPESESLVDAHFLSWMKSDSLLVNVSRGPIIDEDALFEALREKRIGGAALDVWWQYPQKWRGTGHPSRNPFSELDNVVMTPHRAAYSQRILDEQIRFAGENILRFIRGETPLNIVDMKRGY